MVKSNTNKALILSLPQGTSRSYEFTINSKDDLDEIIPFDLTEYEVLFQVKSGYYESLPALIEKNITLTSDRNTVGDINEPTEGKFNVWIDYDDYKELSPGEYPLIIHLVQNEQMFNISKIYNRRSVFRISEQ